MGGFVETLNWTEPEIEEIPVSDFAFRHPAILQLVRCALPSRLARRCGLPSRIWGAQEPAGARALLRWTDGDELLAWGAVTWSDEAGLMLCEIDADHRLELQAIADVLKEDIDAVAVAQVRWVGPVRKVLLPPRQSGSARESTELDVIAHRDRWHADLLEGARDPTTGAVLRRANRPPLRDFVHWRDGSNRRELRAGDALRERLSGCLNALVSNFRLLEDDVLQVVFATPLPMYPGVELIEIIDRRGLRARHGSFFFHPGHGWIFPLDGKSDWIHRLNDAYMPDAPDTEQTEPAQAAQAVADHWADWFSDEGKVATYLDLFLRYVYDIQSNAFFELIVNWNRDLPVNWNRSVDEHTRKLGTAFSERSDEVGLWRIDAEQSEAAVARRRVAGESHVRFFSALILYGRNLWLVVFKVFLKNGVPLVEMIADSICKGGENLQVMPRIHDHDSEFSLVIQPPSLPLCRDEEESLLPLDSVSFEQRSRPVSGQIDGPTFCGLFENGRHWRLPRGESWGHRSAQRRFDLEVADAVSLHGRRDLEGARLAIGVHFRGRLDLRSIKLSGSLTFAHCKFDEPVLMDDAEIDGSVSFQGSEFLGGLSLRGAIVRGSMDLTSAFYVPGASGGMDLSGMTVDGEVNLCGLGELSLPNSEAHRSLAGVRLERARIGGNLRLGNGPGGFREPMLISRIDGAQADIKGSLLVLGACSMLIEKRHRFDSAKLLFSGARIGGNVDIRPHPGGQELVPFDRDLLQGDALDEQRSQPRLGELMLDNARISGNVQLTGCTVLAELSLANARIEGLVWAQSQVTRSESDDEERAGAVRHWIVSIASFDMRGAQVTGTITFEGVDCLGDLAMDEMTVGGMVSMQSAFIQPELIFDDGFDALADESGALRRSDQLRTRIAGNLRLSVMRCTSIISLLGLIVDGHIVLHNATIGGLTIESDVVPQGGARTRSDLTCWEIVPPQVGGVFIGNCEILGRCLFRLIQVLGRPHSRRGFVLENSTIHGDLWFWQPGHVESLIGAHVGRFTEGDQGDRFLAMLTTAPLGAAVHGEVSLRRCDLLGDCDLSLLKVDGAVDLSDTKAGGDVRMAPHAPESSEGPEADDAPSGARRLARWRRSTMVRRLDLSMIECENDLLLSGLCIVSGVDGLVRGRHAKVTGRTVLASTGPAAWLDVGPGCIDLADARLSRLALTDDVFRKAGARLDLDRSTLHTFDFTFSRHGPWGASERRPDGQPCIIMHNADIQGWSVQEERQPSRGYEVACFNRFLCASGPQQEAVWARVESFLRSQGLDDEANSIYRTMKLKLLTKHQFWPAGLMDADVVSGVILALALQSIFFLGVLAAWAGLLGWVVLAAAVMLGGARLRAHDLLQRRITGYGTKVMPIAWAWLLMLAMSMPIYLVADNFELSNSARAAGKTATDLGLRHQEFKRASDEWSLGHAGAMALRYHVPIISLGVEDDWEPRDVEDDGRFVLRLLLPSLSGGLTQPRLAWSTLEVEGVSPQAHAAYMQVLNWIAWPVFLTYMALKLWRDRKA